MMPNIVREFFRCDLCRRSVDADTEARARRGWQPLIVCESCVRDATRYSAATPVAA